jgi:Mn2+/Fe2+ NRAMP family transporter
MDDDLEEKIKSLQDEVNQITLTNSTTSPTTNVIKEETKQFDFKMFKSSIASYLILPFLIFIVLFTWKPSILLEDKTNDKKLSNKKLIVATIVSTIAINTIIIFGVILYKNRISN